jgi:salicylate hydroxylase
MTARAEPSPDILIAGAGIAGLAAALTLARTGRTVTLLEKRAASSEDGAGIQIGPNGSRILQTLGVAPLLAGKVAHPQSIRVMDGLTGRPLTQFPLGHDIEARHGAPYWSLHRADLHDALRTTAQTIPAITLRHAAELTGATQTGDTVTAHLADGETITAPLLIGADGLWSTLRTRVFHGPPLAFTGKCALRTVLPANDVPPGISLTDTTIWLRPKAHVVHYPVRGGAELAIVAIFDDADLGESWAHDAAPARIATRAQAFPTALRDLLLTPAHWRQWSLYRPSGPITWVQNRIVLIGDAAHPPLPFLAQGGVMALEDATVLASLLHGVPDTSIPTRLAEFERHRRPRTTRVMEASAGNGRAYHLDGLMRRARNAVLAATPPHLFMSQYDWLYGWKYEDHT